MKLHLLLAILLAVLLTQCTTGEFTNGVRNVAQSLPVIGTFVPDPPKPESYGAPPPTEQEQKTKQSILDAMNRQVTLATH